MSQGAKAVNPWVKVIRTLKKRPYQENHGCQSALYGRVSRSTPRYFKAFMKAMWEMLIQAHAMKQATPDMSISQSNPVEAPDVSFMKPRSPKRAVNATA